MSVSLFIKSIDREIVNHDIPISTQDVYENIWTPIASRHNLIILSHGAFGYEYDELSLADFIEELNRFISIAESTDNIPNEYREYIQTRSSILLQELKKLEGRQVKFSIG